MSISTSSVGAETDVAGWKCVSIGMAWQLTGLGLLLGSLLFGVVLAVRILNAAESAPIAGSVLFMFNAIVAVVLLLSAWLTFFVGSAYCCAAPVAGLRILAVCGTVCMLLGAILISHFSVSAYLNAQLRERMREDNGPLSSYNRFFYDQPDDTLWRANGGLLLDFAGNVFLTCFLVALGNRFSDRELPKAANRLIAFQIGSVALFPIAVFLFSLVPSSGRPGAPITVFAMLRVTALTMFIVWLCLYAKLLTSARKLLQLQDAAKIASIPTTPPPVSARQPHPLD